MTARIGRLSAGVGHRHPVTVRKASLMAGSTRRVSAPRHQCSILLLIWTGAKVAVHNVVAPAPHSEPAGHLRSATCDVSFL